MSISNIDFSTFYVTPVLPMLHNVRYRLDQNFQLETLNATALVRQAEHIEWLKTPCLSEHVTSIMVDRGSDDFKTKKISKALIPKSIIWQAGERFMGWGQYLFSFIKKVNQDLFVLPGVSAGDQNAFRGENSKGFLSDKNWKDINAQVIADLNQRFDVLKTKVTAKNCLRMISLTNANIHMFVNYLLSKSCSRNVQGMLTCGTMIAQEGNEAMYPNVYAASSVSVLVGDTVFVSFPGVATPLKDSSLNLARAMIASKTFAEMTRVANSVVDVILIDFSSFQTGKGDYKQLIRVLGLDRELPNRLLIITNVPSSHESVGLFPGDVPAQKERLLSDLKASGIHSSILETVHIQNLEDADISTNSNMDFGGGSKRQDILAAINRLQMQESARRSTGKSNEENLPLEFLVLPSVMVALDQLKISLKAALEAKASGDRTTVDRINLLKQLDYAPLTEIVKEANNEIPWDSTLLTSSEKFREALSTGDGHDFWDDFKANVIPLLENPLGQKEFKLDLIQSFLHIVLDSAEVSEDIDPKVIANLYKALPDLKTSVNNVKDSKLKEIELALNLAVHHCKDFSDHDSDWWIHAANGLKLMTNRRQIEKIKDMNKKLGDMQSKLLEARKDVKNSHMLLLRTALLLCPVIWYMIKNISVNRLLFAREGQQLINAKISSLVQAQFVMEVGEIRDQVERYNVWRYPDNNDFIRPIEALKDNAIGDLLRIENNSYRRLRQVTIDDRLRENLMFKIMQLSRHQLAVLGLVLVGGYLLFDSFTLWALQTSGIETLYLYFRRAAMEEEACAQAKFRANVV